MFLRLANVRHRYGDRVALDGVSFAVPRGAIFGLLGPNGAGKSTLFKILAGTLPAQGGSFELAGTKYDPTEPAQRRRIGVVFQDPSLDELLTGRENLLLALSLYGVIGAAARARVDEILALVELGDRQHEPVGRYSGGMKRRLELGRVLLHRPELLLMDEPSRGLDAASLRRYWTELLAWQRRDGLTILLTTHQPEEAQYASRIAVLDGGRLIAEDSPEALQQQVGGDVVTVEAEEASALLPALTAALPGAFQVVRSTASELVLEAPRGHELIPRLVECFPPGRLRSVAMRRPSLGDVFIKLTGRGLDIDTSLGTHPAAPSPRPR